MTLKNLFNSRKTVKHAMLWLIIIFLLFLVILFLKRNDLHAWRINYNHEKQGFYVCKTFDCARRNLNICKKSFFRIELGERYIEEFVYEDKNLCVFRIIKSDKTGMECHFDKTVLKPDFISKIMISNYNSIPEIKSNCKLLDLQN
jgi:hypothetical protein